MQKFVSDGIHLAFLDEGAGEPVLLIHGFASSVRHNWIEPGWVSFLLRHEYRVIAFDNRGHGASDKLYDRALYGAPLMAADARRLMDYLSIARADVMGYSMGARITAFLALSHPNRVRSAIFGGLGANMVRPMAGTGPIAAALEAASIDEVKNATARTFRAFAERTGSDLKALAACIRGSREAITKDMVASLTCPVLVPRGPRTSSAGKPTNSPRSFQAHKPCRSHAAITCSPSEIGSTRTGFSPSCGSGPKQHEPEQRKDGLRLPGSWPGR